MQFARFNPHRLFVFDFDGVICDSARETGISAWKAGRTLWPDWQAPAPPEDCLRRFCQLRPNLETGYQAIGLMKMAVETDKTAEDLTVGETVAWIDRLYHRQGVTRGQMIELFGQTRDAWIATDPGDWLATHTFFPGMPETLQLLQTRGDVFILSTKQERFIHQLIQGQGMDFSPENIFGLERKASKDQTLRQLLETYGQPDDVCFVEDRLETLQAVEKVPDLADVKLFLADWGYNTRRQCRQAGQDARIRVIQPADVPDVFLAAADGDAG